MVAAAMRMLLAMMLAVGCSRLRSPDAGRMRSNIEHAGTLHVRGTCNTHERIDQDLHTAWTVSEKGILFSRGEWICSPIQLTVLADKALMSKADCPERSRDGGMTLLERVESGEIVSIGEGQYDVRMSTNLVGVSQPISGAVVCSLEYRGLLSGP